MTNEEAIKKLKNILVEVSENDDSICYVTSDDADALKAAIQALEQQPCEDAEEYELNEQMQFSETFEEFAKEFGFKDDKEVYTNGSDLIPIFRVKQWLEQNMANESIKALDKLDFIIVEQLDKSTDFKECMTLRWVLDKIAEVGE